LIFLFASLALLISMATLAMVREPQIPPASGQSDLDFGKQLISILKNDRHFRKFLLVRSLMQLGIMPIGFYTVYAVQTHGAPGSAIGLMTAIMSVTQVFANVLLGRLGDRKSHRLVLALGAAALSISALIAWLAPNYTWFYPAFMLAGIAYVTVWATQMVVTLQFARNDQRPAYIGLSNTITAPSALLSPVLGGWLAGQAGYPATFWLAIAAAILTLGMLQAMTGWKPAPVETEPA
jgi:MFS family permease